MVREMIKLLRLKKVREQGVTDAIQSICEDICGTSNSDENKKRADAIKTLMDSLN